MSTWAQIRDAILAAFRAAGGAAGATTSVTWFDGARPFAKQRCLLSVVSTTLEDRDSALDTGGAQLLESMASVQIQATFESIHDTPSADAVTVGELFRLGLRRVSVSETLRLAGMAITRYPEGARQISYAADDRVISAYVLELQLRATLTFTSGEDAGQIEHVEGAAEQPDFTFSWRADLP